MTYAIAKYDGAQAYQEGTAALLEFKKGTRIPGYDCGAHLERNDNSGCWHFYAINGWEIQK